MRGSIGVVLACAIATEAAAVPLEFTHQGRLTDVGGAPISTTSSLTFGLYAAVSGGSPLWSETHSVTPQDGYYSVRLGATSALDPALFTGAARYLGVTMGGVELGGRMAVVGVPYAATARSVVGGVQVGNLTTDDDCGVPEAGIIRWKDNTLEFCDGGGVWLDFDLQRANGSSSDNAAKTCKTLHAQYGTLPSAAYWIDPDEAGPSAPFRAWCDMVTDDGGWTLLLSYDHNDDLVSGSPNLLTLAWNDAAPSEVTDFARDWRVVPVGLFVDGSSELMLKRISNGSVQKFTIRDWIGWDTSCNTWNSGCSYTDDMHMYAIVGYASFSNNYYFHACDGPDCHGTNTYEAVAVSCHAPYPANYSHTNTNQVTYPGSNQSNCPPGRDPELFGFGATSPQSSRLGGWGSGAVNVDIGRVAYYFRE